MILRESIVWSWVQKLVQFFCDQLISWLWTKSPRRWKEIELFCSITFNCLVYHLFIFHKFTPRKFLMSTNHNLPQKIISTNQPIYLLLFVREKLFYDIKGIVTFTVCTGGKQSDRQRGIYLVVFVEVYSLQTLMWHSAETSSSPNLYCLVNMSELDRKIFLFKK